MITACLLGAVGFLFLQLSFLSPYLIPVFSKHSSGPIQPVLPIQAQSKGGKSSSLPPATELEKLNQLVHELEVARGALEEQKEKLEKALLLVKKDNDRKTEELLEAQKLQLSMLPRHTPFYPGYGIGLYAQPATEVGGDYYDYSFSDDCKRLYMVLGDATGHGYKPSILVATAKSYFQTLAGKVSSEHLLGQIGEAIYSLNARGLYMGLSLLVIEDDLLTLVSSGMPPVYYYQEKTGKVQDYRLKGMFLGIRPQQKFTKKVFRMHRGDVLLLMTDGLAEVQNERGELMGFELVKKKFEELAPKSSNLIISNLVKEGEQWKGQGSWRDDMSLMAIKRK